MLPRLHVLVIGPGLGRDPLMQDTCALVIQAARLANIPFILDADGLNLATTRPELVQDYKECILTPNVVEFGRLCKSKGIDMAAITDGKGAEMVSKAFGGITILQKGPRDYICSGGKTFVSDLEGGLKRSGGQGDTLTGSLATFLAWRMAYLEGMWETKGNFTGEELMALAAFGGSSITRVCSFPIAAVFANRLLRGLECISYALLSILADVVVCSGVLEVGFQEEWQEFAGERFDGAGRRCIPQPF